jgi:hypothetical protein
MGQLYSAVTPFPNHKTSLVSPDQSYSDSEESEDTFDESNTEDDPVEAAADRFLRERAYQRAAELYGVKYDTISHDLPVEARRHFLYFSSSFWFELPSLVWATLSPVYTWCGTVCFLHLQDFTQT